MSIRNYILEKIILPLGDRLTGGYFIKTLNSLRIETKLSESELSRLQERRLSEILKYAKSNSNYYKEINIPSFPSAFDEIKHFPIIDKNILRTNRELLVTQPIEKMIRQASSGSSGIQSVVYWTKQEQSFYRATQILWWEWAGYEIGMPILQTGMTPQRGLIKYLKDKLLNTKYLIAFAPDDNDWKEGLIWAKKQKRAPFLGGYASSLFELSLYADRSKFKTSFHAAISWGDKLFDNYKKTIETVFETKIHETYGSTEGMMIAAQKDLSFMYIMSPCVYLELLDENGNEVAEGEIGHVVVTSLVAKGMPLIRYRLGDLAIKLPIEKYPKKREMNLPLLEKVIGRDTDIIKTPKGKVMVVHTFTGIFEHFDEIEQFCVVQVDINGINIKYIPRQNFNKNMLSEISAKIQSYLKDPDFIIDFEEVSEILPTPSGKPQIVVSKIV